MKYAALVSLLLTLLTAPVLAQTPFAGEVRGTLTVDGKAIPLRYAYILDVDNVEEVGLPSTNPQKYQVIVLSDRALPRSVVANRDAPFSEIRSPGQVFAPKLPGVVGAMYGILLKRDPQKSAPFLAHLLSPGGSVPFQVSGTQYPDRITDVKQEGGFVSGTASLSPAQPTGLEKGPKKYQYRVTFRAPLLSEPPVTQNLEGQAALDSPPVRALRSYVEAGKKGDLATVRRLTAPTHHSFLKDPTFVKFLRSGKDIELVKNIRRVVQRGDTATLVVVMGESGFSHLKLRAVRENGDWKLYWP